MSSALHNYIYIYIYIYRKIAPVVRLGRLAPARQLRYTTAPSKFRSEKGQLKTECFYGSLQWLHNVHSHIDGPYRPYNMLLVPYQQLRSSCSQQHELRTTNTRNTQRRPRTLDAVPALVTILVERNTMSAYAQHSCHHTELYLLLL